MFRRRWPVVALIGWSGYVWSTRIVNAWNDEEITAGDKVGATSLAGSVLALAVASAIVLVRGRGRSLTPAERWVPRALAGWTTVVWAVRIVEIATADYSTRPSITNPTGFKVVHVVLGTIAIVLAALTWRALARDGAEAVPGRGHDDLVGAGSR